jgi:hypothetical protein
MNKDFSLHDSGNRKKFESGALRDRAPGKGRYDLISPLAMRFLALIYEKGGIKYKADRNWEKGMPLSNYLDSAIRHLFQYLEGQRGEWHIMQCAWNCFALAHTEEMIKRGKLPKSLNDLPDYTI